jgi:hypothetical protein
VLAVPRQMFGPFKHQFQIRLVGLDRPHPKFSPLPGTVVGLALC